MNLEQLIAHTKVQGTRGPLDIPVERIADHTKDAAPGALFFAISGVLQDGHSFVLQAVDRGASAVVVERFVEAEGRTFTQILVPDSRIALAELACAYYGHPAKKLTLVGLTGTNGKTTTMYILEAILEAAGHPTGAIGTISYRYGGKERDAPTTTPQSLHLQGMLREMVDGGMTHAIMEVTSHALVQHRVLGCRFSVAVFTNITRDHLDYHGDMESYLAAKTRLFEHYLIPGEQGGRAVLSAADPASEAVARKSAGRPVRFGTESNCDPLATDFLAKDIALTRDGLRFRLRYPDGEVEIETALIGEPNVMNVLAACASAWSLGIAPEYWRDGLRQIKRVPGRFDPVPNDRGITVVVDYAHTPDALERAVQTARKLTEKRLICVFGCGGDRDRGKRPLMAKAAAEYSDLIVVTSDNPRSEQPMRIIEDAVAGLDGLPEIDPGLVSDDPPEKTPAYTVSEDRRQAIRIAVGWAREGDLVLIAGKGHETYQIVGGKRLQFDDREVARIAIEEKGT